MLHRIHRAKLCRVSTLGKSNGPTHESAGPFIYTPVGIAPARFCFRIPKINDAVRQVVLAGFLLLGREVHAADGPTAAKILEQYLQLPFPEHSADTLGSARMVRLKALRGLEKMPESAVPAIKLALRSIKDPRQRAELAETLRPFPNPESAAILVELLSDPDSEVRGSAIRSLRLLAGRVNRSGGQRTQNGPEFAPSVAGLLPSLIRAAGDPTEANRLFALFALADTREPAAIAPIRERLKDESGDVRFAAACLLTEFQDAAGLSELKGVLAELRKDTTSTFTLYRKAESLFASFERITGKSFGEIPMNPLFMSNTEGIRTAEKRIRELLEKWADWWAAHPTGQ